MEAAADASRREAEREREGRLAAESRVQAMAKEREQATYRLHAQLERERSGRAAAEKRAAERSIGVQEEVHEAQRQAASAQRETERLAQTSRAAAAAYCLRLLTGRNRGALAHALRAWAVHAAQAGAVDLVFVAEERARQKLVAQAASFQARLEALEYHDY